jgi:Arc/MetJ-type ribon-helix-helix transcriptional regulator
VKGMAKLKMITLKLPEEMIEAVDKAVKLLGYANRSEFIRDAIREKLEKEMRRIGSEPKRVSNSFL